MSKALHVGFNAYSKIPSIPEKVSSRPPVAQSSSLASKVWEVVKNILFYIAAITPGLSTMVFGPMAARSWYHAKSADDRKEAVVFTALATPIVGSLVGNVMAYSKVRDAFKGRPSQQSAF